MPYDFLFTFVAFNQQTAGLEKKDYSLEWPVYQDKHVDGPNISVSKLASVPAKNIRK